MRPIYLLFLVVFCRCCVETTNVFSQNQAAIHSLRRALEVEKDVVRKSRLYGQLHDEYRRSQADSALSIAGEMVDFCEQNRYVPGRIDGLLRSAIELGRKARIAEANEKFNLAKAALQSVDDPGLRAQTWITEANMAIANGKGAEGLAICEKGLSLAEAQKDTLNLLFALDTRARIRFAQGNMTAMQADALRALDLAEKAHRPRQACMAHRALSVMYIVFTNDTASFLYHTNRSLELARKHDCVYEEAETLTQISAFNRTYGRFEAALNYGIQAVEKMKGVGIPGRYAALLSGVGHVYISMAAPEKAKPWFEQAAEALKSTGDAFNIAISYHGMGLALYDAGGRQEGISFLLNAYNLCKQHGFLEKQQRIAQDLAERYAEMRDFENAYAIMIERKALTDSIFSKENVQRIGKLQAEFEFKKKEDALLFEKQLGDRERERQRLLLVAQESDLLVARQLGEIQTLSLRQKDDSLARQQLALRLEQADKVTQLARAREAQQAGEQQRKFVAGVLGGLLILSILLIFISRTRSRLSQERLRAQSIESDMRALRAQMNPHFIFNCLNSINAYIQNNRGPEAGRYLDRFARLMRQILDLSTHPAIRLEDETAFLNNYLALESIRMNGRLTYEIRVAKDVDDFDTELPPMILQPFVENAIWHGITPRQEGGRVLIEFKKENGALICIVEDNGVGRAQTRAWRVQQAVAHESKGLKITAERLALHDQRHGTHSSVTTTDLLDDQGQAAGTRVEIKIEPGKTNSAP